MSIRRWYDTILHDIKLPPGVYVSIKRLEKFVAVPAPKFDKKEFLLVMLPYGNVWSQISPDVPITEDWLLTETDGMLVIEALMRKDAAVPVRGYFETCYKYMINNPDQIGIHMKRRKKTDFNNQFQGGKS